MKNIDKLLSNLETTELEADNGIVNTDIYSQLLAIYLFKNELCYAKYLWKRIPKSIKNNSSDLKNIWTVAQKMWQRDWPAVHIALNVEWNNQIADIMNALKGRIQERAVVLMGNAYSSLESKTFEDVIGMSYEDSRKIVTEKGWKVSGTIINPSKIDKQQSIIQETTEEQLYKLTQFVSFLEN